MTQDPTRPSSPDPWSAPSDPTGAPPPPADPMAAPAPPPAIDPPPPAPQGWTAPEAPATAWTPPSAEKPPSKWRTIIPLVLIAGFIGVVLYVTRDNQSADDMAVGLCFDIPTETTVETVTRHACTEPHDAEVFHNVEFTGDTSTYPITLTLDNFVTENCDPVFQTYVGVPITESEDLTYSFFYPTRESWDDGDRSITCYAHDADGAKLTQSVKVAS